MSEKDKKIERWFLKRTPVHNLNAEREVRFVEMSEINPQWGKKQGNIKPLPPIPSEKGDREDEE